MNRTITTEETDKLFEFCYKHYVFYYDLQVELVDHLASAIEEQWETTPELSFENALKSTFRKFGIHGFSKIKEQKQKELNRKYKRLLWKYLFNYYSWPKILMTLAGTMAFFTLLKIVNNIIWVIVPYFSLLTIGGILYHYVVSKKQLKINVKPGKTFMLLEQIKQVQIAVLLLSQTPIIVFNIGGTFNLQSVHQSWALFLISFLMVSLNIIFAGYFFYIPEKIKEHFSEQFPEFTK